MSWEQVWEPHECKENGQKNIKKWAKGDPSAGQSLLLLLLSICHRVSKLLFLSQKSILFSTSKFKTCIIKL